MSKQVNYNENLVAGAAIRDDKGRRISKLFEASHPKMTVGYAKNLIMPDDPTEQEFNFRQSGGGVIEDGVAVIDKVKGNSVVWNQIIAKPYTFGVDRNFTFASWFNGGSCSINDKGQFVFITNGEATGVGNSLSITPKNTHKYLLSYKVKADIASVCTIYKTKNLNVITNIAEADKWYFISSICDNTDTNDYSSFLNAVVAANSPETTVTIDDAKVTDLTQMFGAGNEPSTYEEFLQRKPFVEDEFAYNEGTIVDNKVEKGVTTGRNFFDSSTAIGGKTINDTDGAEVKNSLGWCSAFIPIIGGETYFCKGVRIDVSAYGVHYYDKDKQHVNGVDIPQNGRTFDAPVNAKYIRIHGLYDSSPANTAILNLSDASFNGQYAPYEKHELDLSWVKEIKDEGGVALFEDGMKSAGTAFDEVTKNKAVKRVGSVDLGTLPWNTSWWDGDGRLYVNLENKKVGSTNIMYPLGATYGGGDNQLKNVVGICGHINNSFIYIGDAKAHSSASEFISSLSGVYAYYELAEPIEVEYDEKSLTYPVVAGGTEEAIASEPSSAFRADIGYGIDAVKTILDLKARVEALEGK